MTTILKKKDWSALARRALTATEIVASLVKLDGWKLTGDGPSLAIAKTFEFADYDETMSFVNAVAFIAKVQDHHPEMAVTYNRCVIQFNTHDVGGISSTDFDCAAQIDALIA